jgi:hypothetical protein
MKPSDLLNHWKLVRTDLYATIDKFSQDELNFAPFEGSWSAEDHAAYCRSQNYYTGWSGGD